MRVLMKRKSEENNEIMPANKRLAYLKKTFSGEVVSKHISKEIKNLESFEDALNEKDLEKFKLLINREGFYPSKEDMIKGPYEFTLPYGSIDGETKLSGSLLHLLILNDFTEAIEYILNNFSNEVNIESDIHRDEMDQQGISVGEGLEVFFPVPVTPLVLATKFEKHDIVEILLRHGANKFIEQEAELDKQKITYIANILENKKYVALKKFIENNKHFLHKEFHIISTKIDNNEGLQEAGFNLLHILAHEGFFEAIEIIASNFKEDIEIDIKVNSQINDKGALALYNIKNECAVVGFDADQYSPLMVAAYLGDLNVAKTLISLGANKNAEAGCYGNSPLMIAASKGHIEIVKLLLDNGADINQNTTDVDGPALSQAIDNGHYEIAKELINKGANVNVSSENGTPLECMIEGKIQDESHGFNPKNLPLVIDLLTHGAKINANMLKLASDQGNKELLSLLSLTKTFYDVLKFNSPSETLIKELDTVEKASFINELVKNFFELSNSSTIDNSAGQKINIGAKYFADKLAQHDNFELDLNGLTDEPV
jgi:ankyrin repeat protein